jgi:hypothetical protein
MKVWQPKRMVVNLKTYDEYDVFIGRPSKWENPYRIGKDGTRKEIIEKYQFYLKANRELMEDIMSLDGKVLGCYCKPLPCHGDVIVRVIEEMKTAIWDFAF